jgi:hypothetical protein
VEAITGGPPRLTRRALVADPGPGARRPAAAPRGAARTDKDALARAESLDTGKRLVGSAYDIDDIAKCFRYFGRLVASEHGRVVDTGRDDAGSRVVHEPVGVCGLITPWNYPLLRGPAGLAEYRETKHIWRDTRPTPQGWFD